MNALRRRALMLLAAACTLLAVSPAAAQDGSRSIILTPLTGTADNAVSNLLAETVTDILVDTLRILDGVNIEVADFLLPEQTPDRAALYYRVQEADRAVYGAVVPDDGGTLVVRARIWASGEEESTRTLELPVESVFDIFGLADGLAVEIASALVDRELAFGTLVVEGSSGLDDFGVYVDGRLFGRNQTEFRVPAGDKTVIIAVPGPLGDQALEVFEVRIGADDFVTLRLSEVEGEAEDRADDEGRAAGDDVGDRGRGTDGPPAVGTLLVSTVPPGASVYLDEALLGETPLEFFGVPEGRYELRLERQFFLVLHGFPGNAARILRKKYSSSRKP